MNNDIPNSDIPISESNGHSDSRPISEREVPNNSGPVGDSHVSNGNSLTRTPTPFLWRSKLVSLFMLIGWSVMIARLIHLQAGQRQTLNNRVTRQSSFSETLPARPGEILDRNGHVLAMTVTRDSLYIVLP